MIPPATPNALAYLALFAYPLVAAVLFRRLPLHAALIWTILAGYLFLPERTNVDLPLLPTLDKATIPSFTAAVLVWLTVRRDQAAAALRRGRAGAGTEARGTPLVRRGSTVVTNTLLLLLVAAPLLYFVNNRAPVLNGAVLQPGIRLYDVASLTMVAVIMVMPFFLARRYLAAPEAQRYLLVALVVGGLVYSMFMLIEIRLSPQLHRWIYGFHSHSFAQHIRGDGFRPMVFLGHGLRVAIFVAMAVLAALALWRARDGSQPIGWLAAAVWTLTVLLLARSLGAFLLVLLIAPAMVFFGPRGQLLLAGVTSVTVMLYPMLRGAGLVPTEQLVGWAQLIDEERADSLAFRFENEDLLLARANQKPLFGWGGMGRNMILDDRYGRSVAIPDGVWVIVMGQQGWVGYVATFGLVCMPLVLILWRRRTVRPDLITAGLALALAINLLDMLPNSSLVPITWLIAGALMGRYETGRAPAPAPEEAPEAAPPPRRSIYARDFSRRSP